VRPRISSRSATKLTKISATLVGHPITVGHVGEWIASQVLDIALEGSATAKGIDGLLTTAPLAGRTVNVKWYLKREGILDVTRHPGLDYYLVMTGPAGAAVSSRGTSRPWLIEAVYLFGAAQILAELDARGVAVGTASSVRASQWTAAQVYPRTQRSPLQLSAEQAAALALFGGPS